MKTSAWEFTGLYEPASYNRLQEPLESSLIPRVFFLDSLGLSQMPPRCQPLLLAQAILLIGTAGLPHACRFPSTPCPFPFNPAACMHGEPVHVQSVNKAAA